MRKQIILSIFILTLMFSLSFVNGADSDLIRSLGTVKVNEPITLQQACSTCTYNNVSAILFPDNKSNFLTSDVSMNKVGISYTYEFDNNTLLGEYIVYGHGDLNGNDTPWGYTYQVTQTGAGIPSDGESFILGIGVFIVIAIAIFLFIVGMRLENPLARLSFLSISAVILFISVLMTLTIITDNLSHLGSIVEGYSTFLIVVKTIVSIAITTLVLFVGWKAVMLWRFKRGFT